MWRQVSKTAVWERLSQPRSLGRTAACSEPQEAAGGETLLPGANTYDEPVYTVHYEIELRAEQTVDKSTPELPKKGKIETRGNAMIRGDQILLS